MKNLHIIAFTTPNNHDVQIGTFLNENLMTNLNIGQGVSVLKTLVLDGNKLLGELEPNKTVKQELPPFKIVEENEQISIERMVAGTRYLAEKYGTKLEQKHIDNLIKRVYESNPTIAG